MESCLGDPARGQREVAGGRGCPSTGTALASGRSEWTGKHSLARVPEEETHPRVLGALLQGLPGDEGRGWGRRASAPGVKEGRCAGTTGTRARRSGWREPHGVLAGEDPDQKGQGRDTLHRTHVESRAVGPGHDSRREQHPHIASVGVGTVCKGVSETPNLSPCTDITHARDENQTAASTESFHSLGRHPGGLFAAA